MEILPDWKPSQKCRATGKKIFATKAEAVKEKNRFRHIKYAKRNKLDGTRIKHRSGKPVQCRAYYCVFCNGYHLTKWSVSDYKCYKDVQDRGYIFPKQLEFLGLYS